ncbi:hypothetical protein [Streptomyces sp. GbtcB6]|uniref:hypothetical protein n=1 Tax=Streptomyces sp. GbtcB6 TaxID=2824751 RepID=UPI001C30ADE3|nr:hypothetical protein [Streptomyces sp. GbtcB6]
MEHVEENDRAASAVVLVSLGTAGVFEALTLLATQDKTVRAASPWQDDPYDVAVSLTQFTVPVLALVIALRLLAWQAPGGADRAWQTVRAVAAMTTLVGLTVVSEWAAVIARVPAPVPGAWTSALIGGLVANSVLTAVSAVLLVRWHRRRAPSGRWRYDWLGDALFVCRRIPVPRRWVGPDVAAWVRRHAMTVFVTLSTLAAAAITGAQAVGEDWTDPLLIAWFLIVAATSNLAFCVISNAVAGFIARPPRTRTRRITEVSVVAGCVAISAATAFRDALWPVFGTGSLTSAQAHPVAQIRHDAGSLTRGLAGYQGPVGQRPKIVCGVLFVLVLRPKPRPADEAHPRDAPAGRHTAGARVLRLSSVAPRARPQVKGRQPKCARPALPSRAPGRPSRPPRSLRAGPPRGGPHDRTDHFVTAALQRLGDSRWPHARSRHKRA